ncbi:hypothetical protein [Bacillus sp. 179-C3.3 HS]|uniref:hypothetical protein n=1 Tax=Bacillus sp. 179-C3.3 HS TaxID=3232162 RepID=UPI0039A10689
MNNMNGQANYDYHGNPYHTIEHVYTANHEHMIAPNMYDSNVFGSMNMPNHYHTDKQNAYTGYQPHHHHHATYSPMKHHHPHGMYGGYEMPTHQPYGHYGDGQMMMPQQMTGHAYGMNQPNAFSHRYF